MTVRAQYFRVKSCCGHGEFDDGSLCRREARAVSVDFEAMKGKKIHFHWPTDVSILHVHRQPTLSIGLFLLSL